MIIKTHHHFLILNRPWPLIMRIIAFNFMFSLLLFFKNSAFVPLIIRTFFMFFGRMYWWTSYRIELNLNGRNSFNIETGIKWGIILFILSEVFFFFSFFWAYFHYFLSPTLETSISWPPSIVEVFKFENIPLINTLILLSSGVTVTVSHSYMLQKNFSSFIFFLSLTVILGLYFSILQLIEYRSSFFSIRDGRFGTSFFVLTGFHGLHVIIGATFLLVSIIRRLNFYSSDSGILSFELASWYWHFVDVVWIFLYFFLYYLNN